MPDTWLRPEQQVPAVGWTRFGIIAPAGWGKSYAIAAEITRRIVADDATDLGIAAPNRNALHEAVRALVDSAPPWSRPKRIHGGLQWPSGLQAQACDLSAEGHRRPQNVSMWWLVDLGSWPTELRDVVDDACSCSGSLVLWDATDADAPLVKFMSEGGQETHVVRNYL